MLAAEAKAHAEQEEAAAAEEAPKQKQERRGHGHRDAAVASDASEHHASHHHGGAAHDDVEAMLEDAFDDDERDHARLMRRHKDSAKDERERDTDRRFRQAGKRMRHRRDRRAATTLERRMAIMDETLRQPWTLYLVCAAMLFVGLRAQALFGGGNGGNGKGPLAGVRAMWVALTARPWPKQKASGIVIHSASGSKPRLIPKK